MYVEQYKKGGLPQAEAWVTKNIKQEDRKTFQHYVIKELVKQGYKGIVPGKI